jgi:hypothetical protein
MNAAAITAATAATMPAMAAVIIQRMDRGASEMNSYSEEFLEP